MQPREREDLMREATALVERAELRVPGFAEPVTVGFRRDGSASVYFGPDEVYQFNTRLELRRAYRDGLLLKAVEGILAQLRRERTPTAVHLLRRDLTEEETAVMQARVREVFTQLLTACSDKQVSVLASVPPEANVISRLLSIGDGLLKAAIAAKPNAQ